MFRLPPDYVLKMYPRGKKGKGDDEDRSAAESGKIPNNETDLKPYMTHWLAGDDHYDSNNPEKNKCENRVMLVGRPQLGKTGVFLYLWYLLWKHFGKPKHTGPQFDGIQLIEIEELVEDEDLEEEEDEREVDVSLYEKYPNFEHIKSQLLKAPCVSQTYGDPNNQEILQHYKDGSRELHSSVTRNRNRVIQRSADDKERKITVNIFNKFISKSLKQGHFDAKMYLQNTLKMHDQKIGEFFEIGKLFIHETNYRGFWKREWNKAFPSLKPNLKYPPIIIPSRGRWSCGLLDLSLAMEGNEDYVQIVVIYEDEAEQYQKHFANYPKICFFVISRTFHRPCVGCSRFVSKLLAEKMTWNTSKKFAFFMDDNILCWDGITLKGDPDPQFDIEALGDKSQRTHISLFQIMEYFKDLSTCSLQKFSLVGFLTGVHKNIFRLRSAFLRRHVHVAVLLNLQHLRGVDYNPNMIAMEDMEFNFRVHELSEVNPDRGVMVKCLRYVAVKKSMPGGVSCESDITEEPTTSAPRSPIPEEESKQCRFCFDEVPKTQYKVHLKYNCKAILEELEEAKELESKSVANNAEAETLDVNEDTEDVQLPDAEQVTIEVEPLVNHLPEISPANQNEQEDLKPLKRKNEASDQPGPSRAASDDIPPPTKTPKKSLKEQRLEKAARGTKGLSYYFKKL